MSSICQVFYLKPFSIAASGIGDCKQHAGGKNHKKVIKENVTQKTFGTSSSFSFVDGNMSFVSANGYNQRFKAMFPDSNIAKAYSQGEAKAYSQGETKVKYYIQFGIAPYFKDELVKDIKGAGF